MMRKQNSTFHTAFLSEAGSELENNDYFAFVELDGYACYVLADGLNDLPDAESAKLATQTVIMAFQERPSIKKKAVRGYLEAADQALAEADSRSRLKASVTVVVTDYEKMRYAYAGNTRLRLYRNGTVREQSKDTSLGTELTKKENLPEDALAKHEQRNNLYAYLGQGRGFEPVVSKKCKLENGDILALYTRGIWENLDSGELDDVFSEATDKPQESLDDIEELLLSRQPVKLENYSFAAVFVDKVFLDPDRKRKIKKIVTVCVIAALLILIVSLALWFLHRQRRSRIEELEQTYGNTLAYIQDGNFVRAGEECGEALKLAGKLHDKGKEQEISNYQKLIEAVNAADEKYEEGGYEEAQQGYRAAQERSQYADHAADQYIEKRLGMIADYLAVFDYIRLGDTLTEQENYAEAEEKYLAARSLATKAYFKEGRADAMDALDALYEKRDKDEEENKQEAKEKTEAETGAAGLTAEGDKAFSEGDYEGASVYYTMALEKYRELGDEIHAGTVMTRIDACGQKSEEKKEKVRQAESDVQTGKELQETGSYAEAKKKYLSAKRIYQELGMEDEASGIDGLIGILETDIAMAAEASVEAEEMAGAEAETAETAVTPEDAAAE